MTPPLGATHDAEALPDDDTVRRIVESSFDLSVIVGADGAMEAISTGSDFPHEVPGSWHGSDFLGVLADETRGKARELVEEARQVGSCSARHLNLLFPGGVELPIEASAVRLGDSSRVLILGASLQQMAEMQQRLVRAQQDMEQEYWQYRNAETRYQTLFTLAQEPFLLVDWSTFEILQANEAATHRFSDAKGRLVGRPVHAVLGAGSGEGLKGQLEMYRTGEATGQFQFNDGDRMREAFLRSVEVGDQRAILIRVSDAGREHPGSSTPPTEPRRMVEVLRSLPDGVAVVDEGGHVRWANAAFHDLVQLEPADLGEGEPLSRWLQGPGAGATVLLSTISDRQKVRLFRSTLTGELGLETDVEISGAQLDEGGWVLDFRAVGHRLQGTGGDSASLSTRVSELSGLLGTVGLKELVGTVSDLVERHLISAALEATGGNRTAAAELLMLSRQTLYTKLRDHDLGDGDGE